MAELLKDVYSKNFLLNFSRMVQSAYKAFDTTAFIAAVMDETWDALPLKARTRRISKNLGIFLPNDYESALDILYAIADSCVGFPYLFFPDFVAVYGKAEKHWELSMNALETFTQKSSSEFAVRSFILSDPERVMRRMTTWAEHANEHVRRLSSEGCRPRLPWGEALAMFKKNPLRYYPSWSCLRRTLHFMCAKVSPITSTISQRIILPLCLKPRTAG